MDYINRRPLPAEVDGELIARFERAAPSYDVIIVSDQAETDHGGVVTPAMREAVPRVARLA